jgi:predicted metallopeptidase
MELDQDARIRLRTKVVAKATNAILTTKVLCQEVQTGDQEHIARIWVVMEITIELIVFAGSTCIYMANLEFANSTFAIPFFCLRF